MSAHAHDPETTIRRLRCQLRIQHLLAERMQLEDLGPRIIREICESIDWDAGGLWLTSPDHPELECHSWWMAEDAGLAEFRDDSLGRRFVRGEELPGRVWASGRPGWLVDAPRDPGFLRAASAVRCGLSTGLAFPIVIGDIVLGVVEIFARERREQDADLLEIVEGIGGQLGQFIDGVQFQQSLQELADRRRTLMRLAEGMRATLSPADITRLLADGLQHLLRYTALALYVQDGTKLTPQVVRGEDWISDSLDDWVIPADEGIAGWILRGGGAVLINHAESDPRSRYPDGTAPPLEHLMAYPLLRDGAVTGVILINRLAEPGFTPHEFDLADSLISTASQALEYSHLLRQVGDEEARKSAILDAALDCIIVTDDDYRILDFNRAAEAAFGFKASDIIGKDLTETIIPPRYREAKAAGMRRYRDTGESHVLGRRLEMAALRADGSEFPIEISIQRTQIGDRILFTANLRDISERRQAEEELVRSRDVAERSLEARNEFFARMSHEIRTPMNGVVGITRLLFARPLDDEARDLARHLLRSSEHLLSIVNDILDLASIDAGRLVLQNGPVHVRQLIDDVIATARPESDLKGLSLVARVEPGIPENVLCDAVRLRQILLNLISNAVKFTEHGEVSLECRRQPTGSGAPRWCLEVRDSGRGITPERQGQLFADHGSVPRDPSGPAGAGLGFQIVRRIVVAMDGTVELTSVVGQGTRITITLPCVEAPGSPASSPEIRPGLEVEPLVGLRLLVVEDNPINQVVAQKTLESWGAVVELADRGSIALACLESGPIDVVLMDIQLEGEDGFAVTRRIRAHGLQRIARVPIIAMTASVLHGSRGRCLEAGMDDFVMKPFDPEDLKRKVARAAGRAMPSTGSMRNPLMRPADSRAERVIRPGPTADIRYLREAARGDERLLLQTLNVFIKILPERLARLRERVVLGDHTGTAQAAHSLRPSLQMVGLAVLGAETGRLEEPGLNALGVAAAREIAERIEGEGRRALLELHRIAEELERSLRAGRVEPAAQAPRTDPASGGAGGAE